VSAALRTGPPGHAPETPYEIGEEVAHERLIETWQRGAELAAASGITLAWEFEPCCAFNTPKQIIRIAKELSGHGFGVLYDTAHAHTVAEVGARHAGGNSALQGGQVEFLTRNYRSRSSS
jgi:sugar phosphate isomerase/epimerase